MVVRYNGTGGLSGPGRGIRTAQKVRLMHAAVRNILLTESDPPGDEQLLGKPVNQEDTAGTLLLFSHLFSTVSKSWECGSFGREGRIPKPAGYREILGVLPSLYPRTWTKRSN